ncbi:unnamed protein product [Closterium sp. Yama58-4]|nr:unnamed protein product [Closterium sp. Yama58-4]
MCSQRVHKPFRAVSAPTQGALKSSFLSGEGSSPCQLATGGFAKRSLLAAASASPSARLHRRVVAASAATQSAAAAVAAPAVQKQRIRIKLKSYQVPQLEAASQQILDVAKETGAGIMGPVRLPTHIRKYCVLRSPHVDKDSREHFEIRTHKRLIDLENPTATTIDALMQLELPYGVEVDAPSSFFELQPSTFHPLLTDVGTSVSSGNAGIVALASGLLPLAASWQQDVAATLFTLLGSVVWVRVFDELARRNVLDQKLSRKIVHITTGLLFMLSWPLFSSNPAARFLAVAVPVANAVRILLLGTGITKNEGVVKSISREGSASELLRGPLYYVLTIVLVTTIFWRSSPVGGIALVLMCAGDGMADIVGRRVGSAKLPWNSRKSWAGSVAMLLCGSLFSIAFLYVFCSFGFFHTQWWSADICFRIFLIAAGATFMESCPISEKLDDNFTVPFSAVLLGRFLLPMV